MVLNFYYVSEFRPLQEPNSLVTVSCKDHWTATLLASYLFFFSGMLRLERLGLGICCTKMWIGIPCNQKDPNDLMWRVLCSRSQNLVLLAFRHKKKASCAISMYQQLLLFVRRKLIWNVSCLYCFRHSFNMFCFLWHA